MSQHPGRWLWNGRHWTLTVWLEALLKTMLSSSKSIASHFFTDARSRGVGGLAGAVPLRCQLPDLRRGACNELLHKLCAERVDVQPAAAEAAPAAA